MSADITEERIAEIRERLEKESLTHDTLEPKDYFAKMCGRLLNALLSARSQLTALQSVPQGVEVPEIMDELLTALEHLLEDTQHRDHDCGDEWCPVDVARRVVAKARLVPTPPQAAPGPAILNPPKQDRDCGDCTRLAICNGELACLCGPTGKMFDRKEPDHPLQPEERRVGPDEVAVDYMALLGLLGVIGQRKDTFRLGANELEDYEAIRHALRTSAQDHNETEKEST